MKKSNNAQRSTNTRTQPTRRATARVLPVAPRPAADYFCRHRRRGDRSSDVLGGWRSPQAPRRQQRRGHCDRIYERSRDLVGARVFCEEKTLEKQGLRRPCIFLGAADGLLCARGRRTSRYGYSGGPASRKWWISPLNQSTTRLKFDWACFDFSRTCHVELGKTPQIESYKSERSPKILLVVLLFSRFFRSSIQNARLVVHFSTNQGQIKPNEKHTRYQVCIYVCNSIKENPR